MTARSGMTELVSRFRYGVNDSGTAYFQDDRIQQILDSHRTDFYQEPLVVSSQQIALGTVVYTVYTSHYRNIEGTASGTAVFRLYDSSGSVISSGYTFDAINGRFDFTADQFGSARYLNGRTYDINGAVADGWREMAGIQSGAYDFRVEGRQYTRSQWFDHCMKMAEMWESKSTGSGAWGSVGTIERSDWC